MSWTLTVVRSSVGKKIIMAVSGVGLFFFLLVHLVGNASSFWGKGAYDAYARHLHALGFPLHVLESLLAFVFLVHILTAITLLVENLAARPNRYAVSGGDRSWSASTMSYSGGLILLFLVVHLSNFHFAARTISIAEQVRAVLSRPQVALFYFFSLSGLTLHVSHGLWSLFQSMGINHPKFNKGLQIGGLSMAVIVGTIFLLIPFLVLTTDRFLQ